MNPNAEQLLQHLKKGINALLAENANLKAELKLLQTNNIHLENTLVEQKNNIKTLQTQNKIVKLAEVLPQNDEQKTELKKELRGFIKQIDECIRLLSETKA